MTTPDITAAAHLIAKLLAHRQTPPEEIDGLIRGVHTALSRFGQEASAEPLPLPAREVRVAAPPRRRNRTAARIASDDAPVPVEAVAPPAPKLVRRAEVAALPPAAPLIAETPKGILRGIVKWYDARTGKGALRLPGFSGDIALEARLLAESGIARLFKGQEVEATIGGEAGAPQLQRLALPGSASGVPLGSGVVHSRRAKPVLVELKREGLRRVAARAEAEQLLGTGRSR